MEKNLKQYQAIIFDLDGTLADSFHFSKRFKSTFRKV